MIFVHCSKSTHSEISGPQTLLPRIKNTHVCILNKYFLQVLDQPLSFSHYHRQQTNVEQILQMLLRSYGK